MLGQASGEVVGPSHVPSARWMLTSQQSARRILPAGARGTRRLLDLDEIEIMIVARKTGEPSATGNA